MDILNPIRQRTAGLSCLLGAALLCALLLAPLHSHEANQAGCDVCLLQQSQALPVAIVTPQPLAPAQFCPVRQTGNPQRAELAAAQARGPPTTT